MFVQQAVRHGVAGLVHDRLQAVDAAAPQSVYDALLQVRRRITWTNMERLRELMTLVEHLQADAIPVMPFKGPVLAGEYYDDLAHRQYGDLDLLVHRDDVLRAKQVLLARGYQPYRDLTPDEEAAFIDSQMAYEFIREEDGAIVEVHWAFIHEIHGFRLDPERVWRAAQTVHLGGQPVHTLAPRDLIIYLAAHGSKHGWYRLLWTCDLDRVVRAHHDVDWRAIREHARRIGSARALRLGLHVAHRWLGTPIPDALADGVASDDKLQAMGDYVEAQWLFADHRPTDDTVAARARFFLRTRERWRDRWAYYRHLLWIAVTPTEKDRAMVALPPALSALYYLLRPIRLLRDGLRSALDQPSQAASQSDA